MSNPIKQDCSNCTYFVANKQETDTGWCNSNNQLMHPNSLCDKYVREEEDDGRDNL